MTKPTLHGFWSYSRGIGPDASRFKAAMEAALFETLAMRATPKIFFDSDTEHGNRAGSSWGLQLVRQLSKTAVFFWNQTPRWITRDACRFELEVFSDRLSGIADHFGLSEERVARLLFPIRWDEVEAEDWLGLDFEESHRFEALWKNAYVEPEMNLSRGRHGDEFERLGARSRAVAPRIRAALADAVPNSKGGLEGLLAFLERDADDFVARWHAEFKRRNLSGLTSEEVSGARRGPSHPRPMQVDGLSLSFLRLAAVPPFWVSTEPLTAAIAQRVTVVEPALDSRIGRRYATWYRLDLATILADLARFSVALPDFRQSVEIERRRSSPQAALSSLSDDHLPRRYWIMTPDGPAGSDATPAEALPLLLVRTGDGGA